MKFILMMSTPWGKDGDWDMGEFSPDDLTAHVRHMKRLNAELRASGNLVSAEGLVAPKQARVVRASAADAPEITDGPFAETKEFLAGFWIVDVESEAEAIAIAARASIAPGAGGKPMRIPIEVRQVGTAPHDDA